MTIRDQIIEAIVAALNTSRPGGIPEAKRSPYLQLKLDEENPTDISVYWMVDDERAEPDMNKAPLQDHEFFVGIDTRAIGDTTAIPERELDPIAEWITKTLNGNTLGGLVRYMRVARSQIARSDEVERPACRMLVTMLVRYQTRWNDASLKA